MPPLPNGLAAHALAGFQRFPQWMWRNADVLAFVDRLRSYNDALSEAGAKIGFYGLDLYSLYGSIEAVLGYLESVDPAANGLPAYRVETDETPPLDWLPSVPESAWVVRLAFAH
jgi:erythromycin esterase-like protein